MLAVLADAATSVLAATSSGDDAAGEETKELFCVCRTPYEEGSLMVGCDDCGSWYHPKCVGLTEKAANALDTYRCPGCSEGATLMKADAELCFFEGFSIEARSKKLL